MQIIVVARYSLAFLPQFSSYLEPPTNTVGNDGFVPKRSNRIDRRHAGDGNLQTRNVFRDIRTNDCFTMRIERRLRAAFNSYCRPNVIGPLSYNAWIRHQ